MRHQNAMATMEVDDRPQTDKKQKMGLPVPHVTSFCCCLGLEMGAKVVGVLHLLVSVSMVLFTSIFASKFGELSGTAEDAGDQLYSTYHKICVGVAVVSVGHVCLSMTLLFGIAKRNTCAIRAWVYIMCALFVLALLATLVNVALTPYNASGSEIFLAFAEGTLFFSVVVYCILCVNSYYLMLKSCEDMEGPNNTPY